MDGAQRGLRSGETGKPLREEGRPKPSPKEPLRLKIEMFICSHFKCDFPVLTMGTGHIAGAMFPLQPQCGHLPGSHRTDVGMASHSLLPAQRTSRAAPGRQVSHETLDKLGCAVR